MIMMMMMLLPPCTFWPAGPLLGVSPLNQGSRPCRSAKPPAEGRSFSYMAARAFRRPMLPPPENLVIFTVFFALRQKQHKSEKKIRGVPPCPNIAPRWPKMIPKMAQLRPNMAPRWPKLAQHGPKMAQHRPKMAQHRPNMAPRSPNMTPSWLNIAPRWPNIAPRWPNLAPN